jgi:hypothetical protein
MTCRHLLQLHILEYLYHRVGSTEFSLSSPRAQGASNFSSIAEQTQSHSLKLIQLNAFGCSIQQEAQAASCIAGNVLIHYERDAACHIVVGTLPKEIPQPELLRIPNSEISADVIAQVFCKFS